MKKNIIFPKFVFIFIVFFLSTMNLYSFHFTMAGTADDIPIPEPLTDIWEGNGDESSSSYDAGDFFGSLDEISSETNMPDNPVLDILNGFIFWLLSIFGILSLIAFIVSGIIYVTSVGNQQAIDKAKKAMTWSIVGVVVGLSGVIIIRTIEFLLVGE